jgi:hypothetical protein
LTLTLKDVNGPHALITIFGNKTKTSFLGHHFEKLFPFFYSKRKNTHFSIVDTRREVRKLKEFVLLKVAARSMHASSA